MRISDWSSDVCSSDLDAVGILPLVKILGAGGAAGEQQGQAEQGGQRVAGHGGIQREAVSAAIAASPAPRRKPPRIESRSEARRAGTECVSTCSSRWSPYH